MIHPDIDATAKKSLSRQLGGREAKRERFQRGISELTEQANDNTERLAGAVRQALIEARESLDAIVTGSELREIVEQFIGSMVLQSDGSITRKQSAAEDAVDVKGSLAGAPLYPFHIRRAFWERLRYVA